MNVRHTDRQLRVVSTGHSLLEAPRWRDGGLYASDFFTHRVLFFGPAGRPTVVCEVPGQPSGLGWTPDGTLLVVSMTDRRLLRIDQGEPSEVADLSNVAPWHCNDMVIDEAGRSYIGNFGWDDQTTDVITPTVITRVEPDGTVTVAADDVVFPNGMAITPDGHTLLVAETFAARITAFHLHADGTLSNRRTWADLSEGAYSTTTAALASGACLPDGIALDAEGALWVADAAGQGALRIAEGGEVLDRVPIADQTAYAVALGGADGHSLYLCTAVPYGRGDPQRHHTARLIETRVDVPVGA